MLGDFRVKRDDTQGVQTARRGFVLAGLALLILVAGGIVTAMQPLDYSWVAVLFSGLAALFWNHAISILDTASGYARQERDVALKLWRFSLVALLAYTLLFGIPSLEMLAFPSSFGWSMNAPRSNAVHLILPAIFYGQPVLAFLAGPGPDLEEEITIVLRHRALRLGYVGLVLVLAAAIIAAIFYPSLLFPTLAWGLFAGIAVPIIAYVVLDWISDRGEES